MRFYLRYTAFVFVLVFIRLFSFSQEYSNYLSPVPAGAEKSKNLASLAGSWEAGAMVGPDFYYGDLNPNKFLPGVGSISAAGGVFITRQFTNVVGLKGSFLFGGLRGSKSGTEGTLPATWSFSGSFIDFTISPVFNLSNLFSPYVDERKIFVYASVGFGINAWNTTLTKDLNGNVTTPDQVKGFQAGFVLPLGLGMQYRITNNISAGIEYTLRTIFSDRVDQTVGGFKCDFINLFAFTASYRWGGSKKKLNVQEYPYSSPVSYRKYTPPPVPPPASPIQERIPVPSASEVYDYVVQVCAYSQHNYTVSWVKKHYHLDMPLTKESENGMNRYIIARYYKDINSARELCDKLRKNGVHDAWIIAYQNGVRHHVVVY